MAFNVVVSNLVLLRINAAIDYIEHVCNNRQYAKRLYDAIQKSILELETKDRFHVRDQEASLLIGRDVNRIKLGRYKLLYVIDNRENVVTVFSFFHEAQNFEKFIASDLANT